MKSIVSKALGAIGLSTVSVSAMAAAGACCVAGAACCIGMACCL